MPADDLGAQHEPVEPPPGPGGRVRAINGLDGRRRRHRAALQLQEETPLVDLAAAEDDPLLGSEQEPLFTKAPTNYELPATLPELKGSPAAQAVTVERRSRIRALRAWWRQESLARAAEKRARANAEAVLRAQAIQSATIPIDKGPSTEQQASSMRSLLTLNEERFQSLGLRSDRLRDELVGISTSMKELRGLVTSGTRGKTAEVAAIDLLGDLEGRFDSLTQALSDELGRRSEENERRISELLAAQSAELTSLLDNAIIRIGDSIPAEMQAIRSETIEELQRLRISDAEVTGRVLGTLPAEIDKVRSASNARLEIIEANAVANLERLRAAQGEDMERMRGMTTEELSLIRAEIAQISEGIREALAEVAPTVVIEAPAPLAAPETGAGPDPEVFDRRFAELLIAVNANTDRLADALHRGLYALELQIARRHG